jgi:hypothetical protein
VSVIVPSFNRADLLHQLLASLRAQHWRPLEAIVIDDGSTDGTADSLEGIWDREPGLQLRILRQPNRGPASARNRGLAAARGDFLYFIDSDDLVEPDGIARMVETLEREDAPYCVAQVRSVDSDGKPLAFNDGNLSRIDYRSILGSRWAIHAALYRRTVFDRAGSFDESLRTGEDSGLRWRIVAANDPGIRLDAVVAVFRRHGSGQVTDDNSPARMGGSMLGAVESFCRWAEPRNLLTAPARRVASRLLLIAAIRLGSGGDWDAKRRALALSRQLERSVTGRLLGSRHLESRMLFKGLEYASRAGRQALHLSRSRAFTRIAGNQGSPS